MSDFTAGGCYQETQAPMLPQMVRGVPRAAAAAGDIYGLFFEMVRPAWGARSVGRCSC